MTGFLASAALVLGWNLFSLFDSKDSKEPLTLDELGGVESPIPMNFNTYQYDTEKNGKATKALFPVKGPYLIHIWATWCPPCVRELPEYTKVASQNPDKFITLSPDSLELIKKFYKEHDLKGVDISSNEDKNILRALEISSLPSTIIVKADGKMITLSGALRWHDKRFVNLIKKELAIS